MSRITPAVRLAACSAAAIAMAACSESSTNAVTSPLQPDAVSATRSSELNTKHIMHTRDWFAKDAARPGGGGNTGISYHGGSVLQGGTRVVSIYWGNVGYQNIPAAATGTGAADGTLIGTFLRNLGSMTDAAAGKSYYNINHTYWGPGGNATTNLIAPTVAYDGFWNTKADAGAPAPSAAPTDADMIALVNWGINNGRIAYDPSTVYAIFTGSGVNLGGGFSSSSLQYCAYHTHGTSTAGKTFFYAAMPYNQQFPASCTSQLASPNADVAANSELNTLAHEIEETTTDDMGNAWFDTRGYENADKCAWTWGTTKTAPTGGTYNQSAGGNYFLVQRNWVNAGSGGCATGY
jgi:hypothetical protein